MAAPVAVARQPVIVRAGGLGLVAGLRELWDYRELVYLLVWRDVKVRYKQTALGVAWAILQPTLTMVVFTVVFGYLAKIPSSGVPYAVFSYAGLLPWQLFAGAIGQSASSLVASQGLLTRVYFPRLVIPLTAVLGGVVDFGVAFLAFLALMTYYGIAPTAAILATPVFALLTLVTALAVGLWLSALNVQYRDIRYTLPFLIQLWLFATPVAYPSDLVPARWRWLVGLNPMAGVVDGFRWALLGTGSAPGAQVWVSMAVVLGLLLTGYAHFRRVERSVADLV